jgi:DNA-binding transcriptional LysR family regulator
MIRLDDIRLFVQVASTNSFTATARHANLSPSQVSVAVKRLEGDLGAALFIRDTRNVKLTRKGEQYLPHAKDILSTLRLGLDCIHHSSSALGGELTVHVDAGVARHQLAQWLATFHYGHPLLRLRLSVGKGVSGEDHSDASIRYGILIGKGATCDVVDDSNAMVLVASPRYLDDHGTPESTDDLVSHACLVDIDARHDSWRLGTPDGWRELRVGGAWRSDDGDLLRTWAIHGLGIALRPWLEVATDVSRGTLTRVLPKIVGESMPLVVLSRNDGDMRGAVDALAMHLRREAMTLTETHHLKQPVTHLDGHAQFHSRRSGSATLPSSPPHIPGMQR